MRRGRQIVMDCLNFVLKNGGMWCFFPFFIKEESGSSNGISWFC